MNKKCKLCLIEKVGDIEVKNCNDACPLYSKSTTYILTEIIRDFVHENDLEKFAQYEEPIEDTKKEDIDIIHYNGRVYRIMPIVRKLNVGDLVLIRHDLNIYNRYHDRFTDGCSQTVVTEMYKYISKVARVTDNGVQYHIDVDGVSTGWSWTDDMFAGKLELLD